MSIELFNHNQIAYKAVCTMLVENGRAAIVHPTGTGKSYIAFRLVEDHPECRFLWLSPSEYIFKTQIANVLSEDPHFPQESIFFATYAKLMLMSAADMSELVPDYIILDEFHRCGAEMWGQGVQRLLKQFPEAAVLGLSATAIRYLDNNRNMAEELFDGHVASEMTLGEAIVRGILPAPVYVSTLFKYQNQLEAYQQRVFSMRTETAREKSQRYLDSLRRKLEKSDGLDVIFHRHMTERNGKYIVFCANVDHMREMTSHVAEWFGKIDPQPHCYAVYSESVESNKRFAQFKADTSDHLKLLFCIDMLNEGVHVSGISGVILFRPTVSPTIYKQQIGRALTAGTSNIPLIIDVVNNAESLRSIDALQKEMADTVSYLHSNGRDEEIVTEKFEVFEQIQDCQKLFMQIEQSLNSCWEQYYQEAQRYYETYGNLAVPKKYVTDSGLNLGFWIRNQKSIRAGQQVGTLSEQQIRKLDQIGMIWENRTTLKWEKGFSEAKHYAEEYGNLLVPATYITPDGYRLGAWIRNQRTAQSNDEMSEERIRRLTEIGMQWDPVSHKWEIGYINALHYYQEHGDLLVPASYQTREGFPLGTWIRSQRLAKEGKKNHKQLTETQIRRLDAIGMNWSLNQSETAWMKNYQNAKLYFDSHNTMNIPFQYIASDGSRLGRWVARQKRMANGKAKGEVRMTSIRLKLLSEIGIVPENL